MRKIIFLEDTLYDEDILKQQKQQEKKQLSIEARALRKELRGKTPEEKNQLRKDANSWLANKGANRPMTSQEDYTGMQAWRLLHPGKPLPQ